MFFFAGAIVLSEDCIWRRDVAFIYPSRFCSSLFFLVNNLDRFLLL